MPVTDSSTGKVIFFGDLHVMGRDGVAFYTESKCVTPRWFSEEDKQEKCVSTREGTIARK
jgi:malonate-semialdehyde dehydrogenase (acetylating)/methylmalonate-semialdehyde dehydrogenase